MQIGFFDLNLDVKETGIGRYGYELVKRLAPIVETKILKINAQFFKKKYIRTFFAPVVLRFNKPDILHALTPSEIAFESGFKFPCKLVVTVHDLLPITFSENWPTRHNFLFKQGLRKSINYANKIIFDSNIVRKEFLKMYPNFDEQKTCVIYIGLNSSSFHTIDEAKKNLEERFDIKEDFFLFVGKLEKRKNVAILLDIIKEINVKHNNLILLIIGPKDPFYQLDFGNYPVKYLNFVSDDDLPSFYSAATGFVFPSLYEGFGIPIAEAMACGCPVICSDIPVLKEIYEGAAIFCPPSDKSAWYQVMSRLIFDRQLRDNLKQKGFIKVKQLSWNNVANETLKVYEEIQQQLRSA
jgi:glycosyltransferase involved in cell wall biosynthesis